MTKVALLGYGRIGCCIAHILSSSEDYDLLVLDQSFSDAVQATDSVQFVSCDVTDMAALKISLRQHGVDALISCLPFIHNVALAQLARDMTLHYFDLTEDVNTQTAIMDLANDAQQVFVPQCGVAPGFINIIANSLMQSFDEIRDLKLRVGALPQSIDNPFAYARTWSTDGLVNQYLNPCQCIEDGCLLDKPSLSDCESIIIDGTAYEAFNTSGGIGSLSAALLGRVDNMNYKTVRYPGHCAAMVALLEDKQWQNDRQALVDKLNREWPTIEQDKVVVFVSVLGTQQGELVEEQFVRQYYPLMMGDTTFTAIQTVTALGCVAVFDSVMQNPERYHAYLGHECFGLQDILNNRFGRLLHDAESAPQSVG